MEVAEAQVTFSSEANIDSASGGSRITKLRKAMDKTTEHCLSHLSYSTLKKEFLQHKSHKDQEVLQKLHAELVSKVGENIKDEVKLMLEEEQIEQLLSDFDELCSSSSSEGTWRPSGVPEDDVSAHLIHSLNSLKNKLQSVLSDVEVENDRLCRVVNERRRLVDSLRNEAIENKKQLMQIAIGQEEWSQKVTTGQPLPSDQ